MDYLGDGCIAILRPFNSFSVTSERRDGDLSSNLCSIAHTRNGTQIVGRTSAVRVIQWFDNQ